MPESPAQAFFYAQKQTPQYLANFFYLRLYSQRRRYFFLTHSHIGHIV